MYTCISKIHSIFSTYYQLHIYNIYISKIYLNDCFMYFKYINSFCDCRALEFPISRKSLIYTGCKTDSLRNRRVSYSLSPSTKVNESSYSSLKSERL